MTQCSHAGCATRCLGAPSPARKPAEVQTNESIVYVDLFINIVR